MSATNEEQMRRMAEDAMAADEEIERSGVVYRAEDVHAWMLQLASANAAVRPKPWQR